MLPKFAKIGWKDLLEQCFLLNALISAKVIFELDTSSKVIMSGKE